MNKDQWSDVDAYYDSLFVPHDVPLDAALEDSAKAGLPTIAVSRALGKFLYLQARMLRARRILEIGSLGGYSAIWLARALPSDGHLITLEADPKHAQVARANIARAGFGSLVDLRIGPALDTLPSLAEEKTEPFDLTFIDADKKSIPQYFAWALKLSHPGSVIIIDNVVRNGAVLNANSDDPDIQGTRRMADIIAAEPRVSATTIQTVGSKGYDGFTLVLVNE
jgi:predicted O-methyltransferase YrrM